MNELASVSLSSPALRGLDCVSSSGALSAFSPEQVALPKASMGILIDIENKAEQTRNEAIQASDEAKKLGVNLAKSGFMAKLGSLALSGAGLGVAIAATVLTGGAALPLVIVSGIGFTLAVADAGCAFADWREKAGGGEGLAMGGDAIGNGVNALLAKMGVNEGRALWWSKVASVSSRVALTVGTLWCSVTALESLPVAGAIHIAHMAAKSVKPAVEGGKTLVQEGTSKKIKSLQKESQEGMLSAKSFDTKGEQIKGLKAKQALNGLQGRLDNSELQAENALFDALMRTKQSDLHRKNNAVLKDELAEQKGLTNNMQTELTKITGLFNESKEKLNDSKEELKAALNTLKALQLQLDLSQSANITRSRGGTI